MTLTYQEPLSVKMILGAPGPLTGPLHQDYRLLLTLYYIVTQDLHSKLFVQFTVHLFSK